MHKPTMQDIADQLSVSRVTVWKAVNNRPGISDTMKEKIHKKAVEIGYIYNEAVNSNGMSGLTVAAVVSRLTSSLFWTQIIHQIAVELHSKGVNLMYTYQPGFYEENYSVPSTLRDGSVSGMIVLNVYSEPVLKRLAKLTLPKVFLDTSPCVPFKELNGSLVLFEGRSAVKEITGRLLDSGRGKLGFIGDVNYALTNLERYMGFMDAHSEREILRDGSLCLTGKLDAIDPYMEISRFISSLSEMPDAFICVSDYIASLVNRYFTEHDCPRNGIVLTGFDNDPQQQEIAQRITTVNIQSAAMGERLADKIMFAIEHPAAPHELCYAASDIIYRL